MGQVLKVDELKQRHPRNGKMARPNVSKRSLEPRDTTDNFLRLAAGLDTDETVPYQLKLRVWHVAVGVLALVSLCVGLYLS